MKKLIITRLFQAVLTTFTVVTVVFILVRMTGDPLNILLNPRATPEERQAVAQDLGLDQPVIVQYLRYVGDAFRGDFGKSFIYDEPALMMVLSRVPVTFEMVGAGLLLAVIIAIPIGAYSAVKRGQLIDILGRGWAFLGMSAPPFWVALMMILLFSVKARLLPVGGREGIESLIMPAVTMAWMLSAGIVRLTRSSMLDVLGSDFIINAKARGLPERIIVWKHAFKNALIPVITYIMMILILMLSGVVIIENIFAWPGLGRLVMTSILTRDFPVIQATTVLISFSFIMVNLITDIIYAYLNPKIRY